MPTPGEISTRATTPSAEQAVRKLADFVSAGLGASARPPAALQTIASRSFFHTCGLMIGASANDAEIPGLLAQYAKNLECRPVSSLVGHSFRTSSFWASLVNGTAARYFDIYDPAPAGDEIPSAVLVAAALAVGEEVDASGADVLTGFGLGAEVAVRLGRVLGPGPASPWDAGSISGSIAATATAGFLMRLTPEAMYNALGTACSMCSGLAVNRGTDTAALHAGIAARNGVTAAALASRGFTGRGEALLSESGLPGVMPGDPRRASSLLDGLGEHWQAIEVDTTHRYPASSKELRASFITRAEPALGSAACESAADAAADITTLASIGELTELLRS